MALLPANPGQALWVGSASGKNHYNVGIGKGNTGGDNHDDYDQSAIEDGFVFSTANGDEADKFYLNSDGNVVFRINAGAGKTSSNTAHPRSELRELTAGGAKAEWDGRTGKHYFKGRSRITEVDGNKPWICFFQCHGSEGSPVSSDLWRVQTEGDIGASTNLSIVCRRSPVSGGSEIRTVLRTGYDVNDWVSWEAMHGGDTAADNGRLRIWLDGVEVLNVTGMGQIKCYFKMGCYLQDNPAKGADPDAFAGVEVERGSFVTWHTGTPQPTTPVFTGGTDVGGGPGGGDGTPDTQAPSNPANLTAVAEGAGIRLNWSAATDNVGVTGYRIYRAGG